MTAVLEVTSLVTDIRLKSARVRPVDGVTFHIEAGETLGLVGESGCGKTLTALSIIRLLPPGGRIIDGAVRLNGRDITSLGENKLRAIRGREMAFIFQDPMTSLNPTMTIGRQVGEAFRRHNDASSKEVRDRTIEVLNLVNMPRPAERFDEYPHRLSGGLRQRVMIAMALINQPQLLIADEPTTALDVTIQAQILALLSELQQKLGMAILLITHDLGVIAGRADRVAVMYAGRLIEQADSRALFGATRHRYTEALLETIPRVDRVASHELYSIPGLPPDLSKRLTACRFAERCRFATDICYEHEPPVIENGNHHSYACHHPAGEHPHDTRDGK